MLCDTSGHCDIHQVSCLCILQDHRLGQWLLNWLEKKRRKKKRKKKKRKRKEKKVNYIIAQNWYERMPWQLGSKFVLLGLICSLKTSLCLNCIDLVFIWFFRKCEGRKEPSLSMLNLSCCLGLYIIFDINDSVFFLFFVFVFVLFLFFVFGFFWQMKVQICVWYICLIIG